MSSKKLYFDDEALKRLQAGVDATADAVKVTLGPRGRHVTISKPYGSPQVTKDGVSVARAVDFDDIRNLGSEAVKEASIKTAEEAGDGTTSSIVIAQAIFGEARKAISAGMHPVFLRRGMNVAMSHALGFVEDFATPVDSIDEIAKVGTLASNGDEALGDLIAEAMEMVGKDGVISVEESQTLETTLEFSEGMQLDRGYLSFDFVLEDSSDVTFENPLVLLADKRLKEVNDVLPAMEVAQRTSRPLMIIAHDLEGKALQLCLFNHLNRKVDICAAKAPRIGEKRTQILENLAVLTGGQIVSDAKGVDLQSTNPEDVLGGSDSVKVDKETTTFVGGQGETEDVEQRVKDLRGRISQSGSEHDKEFYQQQMSQMSGGVAVIRVGAATEIELKEYKARVEDALSATQAAVKGGIVPGGGATLLQISEFLEFLKEDKEVDLGLESDSERQGFDILIKALKVPFFQIMRNAGIEPNSAYYDYQRAVNENNDVSLVMDARDGKIKDSLEVGVIDPALVVIQVIKNGVSTASTLATASCIVVDSDMEDIFEEDQ